MLPASLQPCVCDITRCTQRHSGWEMESSCLISLSLTLLVAVSLQKKWTRACSTHLEKCCSSVSWRHSTGYPPHFTHTSSGRAGRFAFVDLLCGNWVNCSQNGFVTGEIQRSIFPHCPCLCPERTSQQPRLTSLILCSLLPHLLSPFSCLHSLCPLVLSLLFIQIPEWCRYFHNWY